MPTVKLRAGDAVATVEPDHGGRVGQITVGGQRLLVDVPVARDPLLWGAYPMAPWAGRLRNGRFCFAGVEYQMPLDHRDDADPVRHHAIHGLLYRRRWPPGDATAMSWGARLDLDWPLGGEVLETITLEADRLTLTLEVRSSAGTRGSALPTPSPSHRRRCTNAAPTGCRRGASANRRLPRGTTASSPPDRWSCTTHADTLPW